MLRLRTDPDRFAEPAMIGSVSQVFAGHAGEAGFPPAMPHEVGRDGLVSHDGRYPRRHRLNRRLVAL